MTFSLPKLMQYDLFDLFTPTLIDVPAQAELPNVLARQPRGVQLGAHFVPYQLRRTKRRSIGFMIGEAGLQVSAPHWVSLTEINGAILSKQRWILTKLQEQQNRPARQLQMETVWTNGATLPFLGQPATLRVHYGAATSFDHATGLITLNLPSDAPPAQCKKHLHAWLMQEARRLFSQRLLHYAQQLGVHYHSFTLTNARTLWGSCSASGKIRLNWRLIHLSPHVMDYVIAHELAHLHEMNHSARFWATVERVFPDYVAARKELKQVDMRTLPLL